MLLAQAKLIFSQAAAAFRNALERRYEPSKHYMRGPGPKAREAEARAERSAVGAEASAHG